MKYGKKDNLGLYTKVEDERRIMEEKKFIEIKWHTDDVLEVARQKSKHLSTRQANQVLDYIKDHHDASIGISWETISCAIMDKVYDDEMETINL
jgi:CRISPR/Cas system CSM-associated protein Csm2 small subunit